MKRFAIILILCMSIVITGCEKTSKHDTSNLISIKDLKILDHKEISIYFGRPTCPMCSKISPILEEVLKNEKKEIYYFNTDEWRDNDEYENILNLYGIEGVPSIIKIKKDGSFERLNFFENNIELEDITQVKNKIRDFLFIGVN